LGPAISSLHEQGRKQNCELFFEVLGVYAFSQANNRRGKYIGFLDAMKPRTARRSKTTTTNLTNPPNPQLITLLVPIQAVAVGRESGL
jgi:hypothetical protein